MTDADRPRRSRLGWPTTTEPTTTPAGTHDHRLKTTPLGMAFLGITLLFLVNVGLVVYVIVARDSRDAEAQRMNQRINDAICDLLDQLPEGGLLGRPREKYHCGSGIPIADLPPEVADQLRQQRGRPPAVQPQPTSAAASRTAPPPIESGAVSGAPRVPPAAPPTRARTTAPEPSPTPPERPPPPGDPSSAIDVICDATGVCLEEIP